MVRDRRHGQRPAPDRIAGRLSFTADDWDFLLNRRGLSLDVLLRPHVDHIVLGPVAVYKAIQSALGMEKLFPFALVSTAFFLASVVTLFVYLRRRAGAGSRWPGSSRCCSWARAERCCCGRFEVSFTASMATGIAALLALESEDRRGDAIACGLLVLGLAFSELALFFAVGAAVSMVLARRPWSRAYVVVVPVLLYAGWYAGWGHAAVSHASPHNLLHSPKYVLDALASSTASLLGAPNALRIWVGRALLVLLAAAVVLRIRSPKPLPRTLWCGLAILLSFWFLAAIDTTPGREATASRYQYVGVFLLLMVLADLLSGIRLRHPVVLAALGVGCLAVITNLVVLRHNYERMSDWATRARGALAGFEVGGSSADPGFVTGPSNTDITSLNSLEVGAYLSAVYAFGSPAYGASELAGASEEARVAADQLLAKAEELRPLAVAHPPPPGGPPPRIAAGSGAAATVKGSCLRVAGGVSPPLDLPRPGVSIRAPAGTAETIGLRRFASSFPVSYQLGGTNALLIRSDRSPRPWQAQFRGPGPVRVCGLSGGPP